MMPPKRPIVIHYILLVKEKITLVQDENVAPIATSAAPFSATQHYHNTHSPRLELTQRKR